MKWKRYWFIKIIFKIVSRGFPMCIQIISFRWASASQISLLSNWNIRRQGEVLRDRQFLALCTIQIQIQIRMQIQIQLRMQRHCQIGTSVEMKTQTQLQILACLLNNLMASIHYLSFCCQKKLDFASAFMTVGCWPDSSSGVAWEDEERDEEMRRWGETVGQDVDWQAAAISVDLHALENPVLFTEKLLLRVFSRVLFRRRWGETDQDVDWQEAAIGLVPLQHPLFQLWRQQQTVAWEDVEWQAALLQPLSKRFL